MFDGDAIVCGVSMIIIDVAVVECDLYEYIFDDAIICGVSIIGSVAAVVSDKAEYTYEVIVTVCSVMYLVLDVLM